MTEVAPLFSSHEIDQAQFWLRELARDWQGEIPTRIHEQDHGQHYGLGSSPPFAPEFIGYIGRLTCKSPDCEKCRRAEKSPPTDGRKGNERTRTNRAFRKLRRSAPLEYDVLWMAVMYRLTVRQITINLNDRAIARGIDDRYTPQDVVVLAMSAIDKVSRWY